MSSRLKPTGDRERVMKIIGAMTGLQGRNYYFEHNNRNKSIVLDLKVRKGWRYFSN
jgi:hypothetical protein